MSDVRPPTRPPGPPSVRSGRDWMIAIAQSTASVILGGVVLLVSFGSLVTEFDDQPPVGLVLVVLLDAVVGIGATLAIGPLRFLRPGRLHTAVHLPLAALAGFSSWAIPAAGIALYRLGTRRRLAVDVSTLLAVTMVTAAALALDSRLRAEAIGAAELTAVAVVTLLAVIPLLSGRTVGTREALMDSWRQRAAAAEREAESLARERDAEAARVRAEERSALSRDMHDSISHHLAAIALHAGAMAYREDLPSSELRRAAATVRDSAQQANRELHTVLTSLRDSGGDAPLADVPALSEIVGTRRAAGQDFDLQWQGLTPEDLAHRDRSTVVALARVLTEVTANAAKHAPGAPLQLTISREGEQVRLDARNPLPEAAVVPPTSTGHGLLGVQERMRLLGGDARYGAEGNTFRVEARMPW